MANFTRQAIKSSFLKLLSEQPLNKISVRSIVEDCGVNRNSFYYHFQDIPELIREIVTDNLNAIIQKYNKISSFDECVSIVLHFAQENRKIIMYVYSSVERSLYEKSMLDLCEYIASRYLNTVLDDKSVPEREHAALVRFFRCELYGLLAEWIACGMKDTDPDKNRSLSELCRKISDELINHVSENATHSAT